MDYRGQALFPELVILKHFEEEGWDGVWVDTYRKRYLVSYDIEVHLRTDHLRLLDSIYSAAGSRSGCFDVLAWKGDSILFAESKWAKKDKIQNTQIHWLFSALSIGMSKNAFLIVEWELEKNASD